MSEQRETDIRRTQESIRAAGGKVSGGQLVNFREGWAVRIIQWSSVAHYFVLGDYEHAYAKCGKVDASVAALYGPGDFDRCRICERVLKAQGAKQHAGQR